MASYNLRSLFPKVGNFKTDMIERKVDCAFVSEVWEQSEDKGHLAEIEKMLQMDGLQYISTSRPNKKSGGGVALIVNTKNFACEKLKVFIPTNVEAVWGLLTPKSASAIYKKIIVCAFYSPPKSRRNSKLADHIVGTLQMLVTKYPECGIILGADKNTMDIRPILNCGLRLRQEVTQPTRQGKIIDVIIMNLGKFYNLPIIAPPIGPDDPNKV